MAFYIDTIPADWSGINHEEYIELRSTELVEFLEHVYTALKIKHDFVRGDIELYCELYTLVELSDIGFYVAELRGSILTLTRFMIKNSEYIKLKN